MAEWAAARDLKSCGGRLRVGSSPTPGILKRSRLQDAMVEVIKRDAESILVRDSGNG